MALRLLSPISIAMDAVEINRVAAEMQKAENAQVEGGVFDRTQPFRIASDFTPTGDQPAAIKQLVEGINDGLTDQVLLGVTGSGKTFTMAHVIQETQRPALILAPNKTLARAVIRRV